MTGTVLCVRRVRGCYALVHADGLLHHLYVSAATLRTLPQLAKGQRVMFDATLGPGPRGRRVPVAINVQVIGELLTPRALT